MNKCKKSLNIKSMASENNLGSLFLDYCVPCRSWVSVADGEPRSGIKCRTARGHTRISAANVFEAKAKNIVIIVAFLSAVLYYR